MPDVGHLMQFFDAEAHLVEAVSLGIREEIDSGCTCIVLATAARREKIDARLREFGMNPAALMAEYQYIALDAQLVLATFMTEGRPDQHRFHRMLGLLIMQAAARGRPVRVFSELVAVLAEQGLDEAAVQLEELWNELSRHHSFTLFCACPRAAFSSERQRKTFAHICAIHSHVIAAA